MAGYSSGSMLNQNTQDFPNNNSGQITPAILRGFNANLINSVQFTDVVTPNATSASYAVSASVAVSASYAANADLLDGLNSTAFVLNSQTSSMSVATASFALTASFLSGTVISASYAATASTAISSSYALSASQAQNAITANSATSASYSNNSTSASYALTASFASNVTQIATGSFATTGSNTFTGDQTINAELILTGSKFFRIGAANAISSGVVGSGLLIESQGGNLIRNIAGGVGDITIQNSLGNVDISGSSTLIQNVNFISFSASLATSISNSATSASNALITASVASNVITFTKGGGTTFTLTVDTGSATTVNTGSLATTASLNAYTASTNTFTGSIQTQVNALQTATSSYSTNAIFNAYTSSTNTFTGSIQTQVNALEAATSSYVKNSQTSSMSVLSASFASTIASGLNITASNILVNNNLTVNGTASFAYLKTVTGSAVVIGDAFIILNADTPTLPFAGIKVYDTGSASTASFEWNGNGDYWIGVEESGQSAGFLTGTSGSKGSEVFPTLNRLTKGSGNNEIRNSNITDDGSSVSINSNTLITGSLNVSSTITGNVTGNLTGTASFATSASVASNSTSASYANNATSASFASTASFALNSSTTGSFTGSFTGSLLGTASFADNATSASYSNNSTSASFALTASFVATASNAVSSSYSLTATSASYALVATSASFAPSTPAFPFTGSAEITGSLSVTGSITSTGVTTGRTGSLVLNQQGGLNLINSIIAGTTKNIQNYVTESYNSSIGGSNIYIGTTAQTSTGSFVVSGSGNYINVNGLLSNANAINGAKAGFSGFRNFIFSGAPPTNFTGSGANAYTASADAIQMNGSWINASVSITANQRNNQFAGNPVGATLTNSFINSNVTSNSPSASLSIINTNVNATISTAQVAAQNSIVTYTAALLLGGTHTLSSYNVVSGSSIALNYANRSIIVGSTITQYIKTGSIALSGFNDVIVVSNNATVTGSLGITGSGALFGSWPSSDGRLNDFDHIRLAIGTGTGTSARRTSLYVSSSGITVIQDNLIVSGSSTFTGSLTLTGSLNATSVTSSLFGTASFADNATSASYSLVATSASYAANSTSASYALTASFALNSVAAFPFTGSAIISGSLGVTGSTRGNIVTITAISQTASLDLNLGNAFVFNAVSSSASASLLTLTNIPTGSNQKFSLLISQSVAGGLNVYFDNTFQFPSASQYTVSTTTGSVDLLTFETYTY